LPSDLREVVHLRQWEELSFVEIGERLGCTEGTARMRLHRGLQRLGGILTRLRRGGIESILADDGA
jgi:RNA polymerase sigma-70 factor (ECF subfamily)